ncbi:MXAN_5453 family MXYO-CTERM-anchored protein [Stigmatella erecta]|uniref:Myxococcales GC_trans_RRR domain-containing protein/MYXO-CTERM domain-containing protein n=1 Tax=Stigmatella erecta TaxID=83460 RepID=A0A1I0IXG4_9BACT|nr:MXAN_5453 family MXYO-CTERM-anchored protein [Stigmatella erecta]SEU02093.1 Myxococcales GC_trans_RRR domain-containing protein/MYXO-CTERM domain-containing protein [Stigmatella erecta]
MRSLLIPTVLLGGALAARPALAELPDYTLQIQARINLVGNPSGAYNLAPGNLLPGSYHVPLTLDRQLAFRLSITPEGRRALWWGQNGVGSRIYLLPELGEDTLASDPGLNAKGDLAFAVTYSSSNGIYLLNASDPGRVTIVREPIGANSWEALDLNEAGQLGFRVSFSGVGRAYVRLTPLAGGGFTPEYLAKEQGVDPASPFFYLYSPGFNDQGQVAGVVDRLSAGSGVQELRVWSAGGNSQLIAASVAVDPASPIYRFASVQPALSNTGQVAFLGTYRDPGGSNFTTLWLWDGTALKVLAQNGKDGIKEVEFFPPDINDQGLVVFRAFDSAGLRAVWVSDGETKKRVVSEHDIIPSDLGDARVDQETATSPVFGGSPKLNARGDVTFVAGLAPPDNNQEEWGSGIYVAQSSLPPPGSPDGGTDGGTDEDGGPAPEDGGPGPDGGTDEDGGPAPDGGPDEDGGTDLDGGEEGDGGPSEPPDGGWDAGTDGGSGSTPDAGAGEGDLPESELATGGCGCQSGSAASLWPWMVLGMTHLLGVRRRRSRPVRPWTV